MQSCENNLKRVAKQKTVLPRRGLSLVGLKACNMIAQGNALGNRAQTDCALKGQNKTVRVVSPFQGLNGFERQTQGVALGCHVVALSARN
jgi:hypothetical protein